MYRFCINEMVHYERVRSKFCQVMAEGANRPQNVTPMHNDGVIDLMQPLLCDPELVIRSNAVCFFGRMANHSSAVAAEILERQIPQIMLRELLMSRNDNNHFRRAVVQALKAVAKHNQKMAEEIAEIGGLSAFLICAENRDVMLKEAACCGIGTIVKHSPNLTQQAIEQGAISLLQNILQQSELNLKQFAVLVFGDIARHSAEHARPVCIAIGQMSQILNETIDTKLKKQILCTMANVAEHSCELAEIVVNENVLPTVLIHLGHDSVYVQKQAARLVQEIAKQSLELAQIIVNSGGIGALVNMLQNSLNHHEDTITPCAMAIAYIAGQSPHFALALIECKTVYTLVMMLEGKRLNTQLAACIWALGHIGKHSSEHCKSLADTKAFARIMEIYINPSLDNDVRRKSENTLKMCLPYCLQLPALEPLLYIAPSPILEMILEQFAKVLPNDSMAQRLFISTGGLKKILDIDCNENENITKWVSMIKSCFSDDIVNFYKPPATTQADTNLSSISLNQLQPKDFFVNPLADDTSQSEMSERSSFI